jgi:DNA-binding NarL/FixJ family response regulator
MLKRAAGTTLAEGIRAVWQGGVALHAAAARILVDAYLRCECAERVDRYEQLTDREREVLILVAEGHTNQQIAALLQISPKTVDTHRTSLMSKLDLHDRTEVVKYALRRQLIEL